MCLCVYVCVHMCMCRCACVSALSERHEDMRMFKMVKIKVTLYNLCGKKCKSRMFRFESSIVSLFSSHFFHLTVYLNACICIQCQEKEVYSDTF